LDRNFFEIAYAFKRQFGDRGLYCGMPLYNFADNHDVNRVASLLENPAHLYTLYCLLFTMPGVPSIYYGSEWGIHGTRTRTDDSVLRPSLEIGTASQTAPHPELSRTIARLAQIRHAFARQTPEECVVVAVNSSDKRVSFNLNIPFGGGRLVDLLNPGEEFQVFDGRAKIEPVWPCWARIMKLNRPSSP
jgi:cyclomaltodextrinase